MNTGLADAMVIGQATLDGRQCELAVMDFSFMGGSMGSVVGEKFSRACDSAAERGVPLIAVTSSGGARMQEGILSLMQLPKTVCAVEDLHDAGQPMFVVMAHPTTGGVLASFASLGDVLARRAGRADRRSPARASCRRPRARSCPRTSGSPSRTSASATSTRSCPRPELRPTLSRLLRLFDAPGEHELRLRERLERLRNLPLLGGAKLSGELERLQRQLDRMRRASATDEEIWRSVELARHDDRPYTLDYVERLLDDWFELHGDRGRADDGAMVAGLGKLDGRTVALVGQQKGRDIQERAKPPVRHAVSRRATRRRCA